MAGNELKLLSSSSLRLIADFTNTGECGYHDLDSAYMTNLGSTCSNVKYRFAVAPVKNRRVDRLRRSTWGRVLSVSETNTKIDECFFSIALKMMVTTLRAKQL